MDCGWGCFFLLQQWSCVVSDIGPALEQPFRLRLPSGSWCNLPSPTFLETSSGIKSQPRRQTFSFPLSSCKYRRCSKNTMVLPWYTMVEHGIPRYYHGTGKLTMVLGGISFVCTMVNMVIPCMVYSGIPWYMVYSYTVRRTQYDRLSQQQLSFLYAVSNTKSSAVVVIADRTEYDVRYSYRPLPGITVVSMSV